MSGGDLPSYATPDADAAALKAARAAIADHRDAVEYWLKSPPADRPQRWRAVEAAWHACKQLGAEQEAARHAAVLMRADGKLRSVA